MESTQEKYWEMYENYINGNIADHREQFEELKKDEVADYLVFLFSVSGAEYPKIIKSLKQ